MIAAVVWANASAERSRAIGIAPGTFAYKVHASVPLLVVDKEFPPFQRVADVNELFGAPFVSQAGEHGDMSILSALVVSGPNGVFDGSEIPRETVAELPPGPILNLGDIAPCSHYEFVNTINEKAGGCPAESQVGVVSTLFAGFLTDRTYPLYKLASAHGHLASFGYPYQFIAPPAGILVNIDLRTDGDYGITISSTNIGFAKFVPAPFMTIWGTPAAAAHDLERWNPNTHEWGATLGEPPVALIANATDCDAGIGEARARLRYWTAPDRWLPEDPEDPVYRSFAPMPSGCDRLEFTPQGELSPSNDRADSPAGIELRLTLPRGPGLDGLEEPLLEEATVTLPEGMSVNPGTADGLMGCTPEQIGLASDGPPEDRPIRFSAEEPRCPLAAKVGDGVIDTPISEDPVEGDIYLATPFRNPFHSLFVLYLVFEGPGITAKLAAEVEADPTSGQLRASVVSLPPVPVRAIELSLPGGPRGPLTTPPGCGEVPIEMRVTPRSSPYSGPPERIVSRYAYSLGGEDGACTSSEGSGSPPPVLLMGSRDATGGGSSPLVLRLERDRLETFEIALPRGLAGRVRTVGQCAEADIARAMARREPGQGILERDDPSCPASTRVGSLLVGAGPGPSPLFVSGDVYLAGPYRGAPFSLVGIAPALAGGTEADPLFDLGTVIGRTALDVNRRTGAVSARVDALPQILGGVPLRIESVTVVLDRPGFIRNPSSCGPMKVAAMVKSGDGARTSLLSDFRSLDCGLLGFAPKLSLAVVRGRGRGQHPTVRAVLRARAQDAGIASARISLPVSELLDRGRLRTDCHALPLSRGACPRSSIRGRASAWSGLIDLPLRGPVYLRSLDDGPPELVLALAGRPEMEVVGRLRLQKGRVRVDFSELPDAQLTKLTITLWGGRRGFFTNARDLCRSADYAAARLVSSGAMLIVRRVPIEASCEIPGGRFGHLERITKRMER